MTAKAVVPQGGSQDRRQSVALHNCCTNQPKLTTQEEKGIRSGAPTPSPGATFTWRQPPEHGRGYPSPPTQRSREGPISILIRIRCLNVLRLFAVQEFFYCSLMLSLRDAASNSPPLTPPCGGPGSPCPLAHGGVGVALVQKAAWTWVVLTAPLSWLSAVLGHAKEPRLTVVSRP